MRFTIAPQIFRRKHRRGKLRSNQCRRQESFRQCPESFLDPQENSQLPSHMGSEIDLSDNPQVSPDRKLNLAGNKTPIRENWVLVLAAAIFLVIAAVYAFAT